jgi:hypothetical protein
MADRKTLQYELAGGQSGFKAFAHTYGRANRAWLAANFFTLSQKGRSIFS